jgi:hypothetical protein
MEVETMPQRKKPKHLARKDTLEESQFRLRLAANGSHPAEVSGMFQDDPTFEDFRNILHEQREADYRRASEEIEALTHPDHAFG